MLQVFVMCNVCLFVSLWARAYYLHIISVLLGLCWHFLISLQEQFHSQFIYTEESSSEEIKIYIPHM